MALAAMRCSQATQVLSAMLQDLGLEPPPAASGKGQSLSLDSLLSLVEGGALEDKLTQV
jgi:hypothetical protein